MKEVPENILKRIQKCLRLSESDNAGEAAAAIRQARKLMEKYGVSMEDVQMSDIVEKVAGKVKTHAKWYAYLMSLIHQVFGVRVVSRGDDITFIGSIGKVRVAIYVYSLILRQIMHDRKKYLEAFTYTTLTRKKKINMGDLYCEAWLYAVEQRVRDLFVEEDEALKAHMKKYGELVPVQLLNREDEDEGNDTFSRHAVACGASDGLNAQIFMPVEGAKKTVENKRTQRVR